MTLEFSGGGGGGGGGSFKQTPDTLRSNDSFEGIIGVCAGPIKGPVNGLNSVMIDGTRVEDENHSANFDQMTVVYADGDPAKFPQTITPTLGAGGSPVNVNLAIGNLPSNTKLPAPGPGPWVTKTITNQNADYLDIRLVVSALYRQDDKGIFGTTANIEVQLKPTGATNWIAPQVATPTTTYSPNGMSFGNGVTALLLKKIYGTGGNWLPTPNGYIGINGKTTSPYVYELRLKVPNTGAYANRGWDVRIRLIETENLDADPKFEKRNISWESLTAVYTTPMGTDEAWRGLAWLQVVGKASDQLSGVPEVSGIYDTKIVQVPPASVFNPATRTYSGVTWDGSWTRQFTTDPAWIINDAISDGVSGISLITPGAFLNKWDALEASKWFSQQVPDGAGGTHCRSNLNLVVDQPQKADEFVRFMAGAVGAFAWDVGNGEWRMKVDKPANPVDVFTRQNIVSDFTYTHTDVDTRYNEIKLTFLNEEFDYRQDFVTVYDNPSIAKFGRKPTTIVAIGCTNRQEALRRAKLRLRTSINETKTVSFTTNRRGRMVNVFDTILVADTDLGFETTGRVVSVDSARTTIQVRDPMRLEVGVSYQIRFTVPNPAYNPDTATQPANSDWCAPTLTQTIALTNSSAQRGDVTTLYLASALPANAAEYLVVALEASLLQTIPKQYRVLDVKPDDKGELIAITAMEIDTGKWDAADNVTEADAVYQDLRGLVPAPDLPYSGQILTITHVPVQQGFQTVLTASWARPAGVFISGFQVAYSVNGATKRIAIDNTQQTSFEFPNPAPGEWSVEIRTIDRRGGISPPLTGTITIDQNQLGAGDIKYGDGTSVEVLKPAEPGATKGLGNELIGGMTAQQVADSIGANSYAALSNNLAIADYQAILAAKTQINGQDVTTYVKDFTTQQTLNNSSYANQLALLGASNAGGTAFILNDNLVKTSDGQVLSQRLATTEASLGNVKASVDTLNDVVIDRTGATVRSVLKLDNNGYISGMIQTNNGQTSSVAFLTNSFAIVDPNGGAPFTPFSYANGVIRMSNVEVDTLKYSALVPLFGPANGTILTPNGACQIIPGGFMIQTGKIRQDIASEVSIPVTFPKPFPTAVVGVIATGYLSSPSIYADIWVQNVGTPTLTGCQFFTQAVDSNPGHLQGIDWVAYGY